VPMSLGLLSYGFFCNICPAATLQSMFPYYLMGQTDLSWIRLGVLLFVLLLAVVSMRSFCKLFCPIGAILAIFNRFSALSLRYEQSNCPSCQICLSKCPMDIKMEQLRAPGNPEEVHTAPSECILCLNCTQNCPKSGLSWNFWGLFGRKKEEGAS
jgi:ferredoxin-type protein NapH